MRLAAWGLQRVADMSREDLEDALNQMWQRYMMLHRAKMRRPDDNLHVPYARQEHYDALRRWFGGYDSTPGPTNTRADS